MSGFKTPEQAAADWVCPNGKIMHPPHEMCIGPACAAWRWRPLMANRPDFVAAIQKRMKDTGEAHPAATKYVNANKAEFGLPTEPFEGSCGLGGGVQA